ncbi:alkaline phosphatase [Pseudorhodoferax sp. Leaf267]|uniref:alkaline phosphatase D family protein n=1 Tax=Pseudorhodoferax sp. Leaf267 TaxID=1736316 RepID=UPI0006F477B0|nr:alkaline phosphatase D family protein [Pseudorhodoferax sp. Leaf267]KQP17711.1 alkaline phosphatase [Pseudorhodoferax sp. Leaf267]
MPAERTLDRRAWLQQAAAAATTLWLPRAARSQPRLTDDPFTLGVASGSPRADGVVLWTRLHLPGAVIGSDAVTLRWEVAHDEAFTRIAQRGQVQALPDLAHSAHAEVQGLAPDRWYFYRFMAGDAVSPTGRTRTLPAADAPVTRLRLAYASCQRWEHGYFSAYRHMAEENLDLVLFLGDYIYEYPTAAQPVRIPSGGWVLTLDDYRQRYALHKSEPELQRMHAACPWLVTWDDHEVQNDYAGSHVGQGGPAVADFAARRAAAYQAFYEHMPLRASVLTRAFAGLASGAEMRIHGQLSWGRLASLMLLDARQFKSAQACTPEGRPGSATLDPQTCETWADPERSMLGTAQEQWLDQTLATQGAAHVWNFVGQQSLLGQRGFRTASGQRLWNDGWDGYAPARRRLTDALQQHRVANPVFLGGDVHENWVGHVKADYADPASASVGVEFCGTSITARASANPRTTEVLAQNPHFVFADAQRRGYGVVECTPQLLTTRLRVLDDVTRRDTQAETLASFVVEAGRAVVERA